MGEIGLKYKDWIDVHKIKEALAGFEKKKSPGPDGVKPLVFEHCTVLLMSAIQIIGNTSGRSEISLLTEARRTG